MKTYLIGIVLVILLAEGAYYFGLSQRENNISKILDPKKEQKVITPTPETSKKDFISTRLGISFNYKMNGDDPNISTGVLEKGNIVYVYGKTLKGDSSPEGGQSVEVFNKRTEESFKEAVKRIILAKYPSKDCIVSDYENRTVPKELILATIKYPTPANPGIDPWFVNAEMCNAVYSETNGVRYFAYNPKYPDRFFFFDIGQDGILARDGKLWQQSFEVLPKN